MTISVGIDVGAEGGIAFYDGENMELMPLTHNKGETDVMPLIDWLRDMTNIIIAIEQPNKGRSTSKVNKSQRKAGMPSTFQHLGQIQGALKATGRKYDMLAPQTWQTAIRKAVYLEHVEKVAEWAESRGKTLKISKVRSIAFCIQNGWEVPMTSKRKTANYHDGFADAMCIAWLCHREL